MDAIPKIKACGVLIVRGDPIQEFLLMEHKKRLDLPKGHMEEGETERTTALREMEEETGIKEHQICLDEQFRFETRYDVWPKRFGKKLCHKTTVIFLARLRDVDADIQVTEHIGYRWLPWDPPHQIQPETIDPLMESLEKYLRDTSLE